MDMMEIRRRLLMMGGGNNLKVEAGTYIPITDVRACATRIPHSLGIVPDFVVVMADAFTAESSFTDRYIANSYCSKSNLTASNRLQTGVAYYLANWPGRDTQWLMHEDVTYTKFLNENYFLIPYYNTSDILKAGTTYHYVVGKFN